MPSCSATAAAELADSAVVGLLRKDADSLGFEIGRQVLELQGTCSHCRDEREDGKEKNRRKDSMNHLHDGNHTDPLPVSLLTGFLGSGKTTVLNHLLRHPELENAAVIINEFGDVGLDHDLLTEMGARGACAYDLMESGLAAGAEVGNGYRAGDRVLTVIFGLARGGIQPDRRLRIYLAYGDEWRASDENDRISGIREIEYYAK